MGHGRALLLKIAKIRAIFHIKSEMGIVYVYRAISLLVTSAFYLFEDTRLPWLYKSGVAAALFLSAIVILRIYASFHKNRQRIPWGLVLVETIGITVLLIPTGGLSSPFLWYALNPVLVSACFLTAFFSWCNLIFFCCCATAISFFLFNPFHLEPLMLVSFQSYVFLVFGLITYAVRLLTQLLHKSAIDAATIEQRRRELEDLNARLIEANKSANESMDHIMALYRCVGALTSQSGKRAILKTFVDYAATLSQAASAFFLPVEGDHFKGDEVLWGAMDTQMREALLGKLEALKELPSLEGPAFIIEVYGRTVVTAEIDSPCSSGLLGVAFEGTLDGNEKPVALSMLTFLSRLCVVVLERIAMEEVENRLLIAQEQNRIANEMHDSVSQRLFSIVCAMHSISARWGMLRKLELKSQLDLVAECAAAANQELRSCIYSLNLQQRALKFFNELKRYLDNIAQLNNLRIETDFAGNEALLTTDMKRAIDRMVRETVSNAIRHGKCRNIDLQLYIFEDAVRLKVTDDGDGAAAAQLNPAQSHGLGLNNMRAMAQEFNGNFSISSDIGVGTRVSIVLPFEGKNLPVSEGVV